MYTPRHIAIRAVHKWLQNGVFLDEFLDICFSETNPNSEERRFIYEISLGTVRNWRIVKYYMTEFLQIQVPKDPIKQAVLGVSLYQRLFHEIQKTPYALVNEYVQAGKLLLPKDKKFSGFVNAILRKSLTIPFDPSSLEKDSSYQIQTRLAIRFSMTEFFVQQLLLSFGEAQTYHILQGFGKKPQLFQRGEYLPETGIFEKTAISSLIAVEEKPLYIQSSTHPDLMEHALQCFVRMMPKDTSIRLLDLCSAPGGKAIMCWQAFKVLGFQFDQILLNEPNPKRQRKLEKNRHRFQMPASISTYDGRNFPILENHFNVILLDPPCSNSGVLFKCPEARYRITKESITEQVALQYALLERAIVLLKRPGWIFYTTCSILPDENERLVQRFLKQYPDVKEVTSKRILPSESVCEGGFLSLLYLS